MTIRVTHLAKATGMSASWVLLSAFSLTVLAEQECNEKVISKPDSMYQDNFDGTVTEKQTGLIWKKCGLGYHWNAHVAEDPFDDSCDLKSAGKNKKAKPVTHFDWQTAQDQVFALNGGEQQLAKETEKQVVADTNRDKPSPAADDLASSLALDLKAELSQAEADREFESDVAEVQSLWRLPQADELMALADSGCALPAINSRLFPGTENTLYWTATDEADKAQLIYFSHASQIALDKQRKYAVRLVRSGAPILQDEAQGMMASETEADGGVVVNNLADDNGTLAGSDMAQSKQSF